MTTARKVRRRQFAIKRKRLAINGGRKVLMVTAERGRVKILWISTESRLIRIRRTENLARLTRPTIPFLYDSLRVANQESEINRQENELERQGMKPKRLEVGDHESQGGNPLMCVILRAKKVNPSGKVMKSRGERS